MEIQTCNTCKKSFIDEYPPCSNIICDITCESCEKKFVLPPKDHKCEEKWHAKHIPYDWFKNVYMNKSIHHTCCMPYSLLPLTEAQVVPIQLSQIEKEKSSYGYVFITKKNSCESIFRIQSCPYKTPFECPPDSILIICMALSDCDEFKNALIQNVKNLIDSGNEYKNRYGKQYESEKSLHRIDLGEDYFECQIGIILKKFFAQCTCHHMKKTPFNPDSLTQINWYRRLFNELLFEKINMYEHSSKELKNADYLIYLHKEIIEQLTLFEYYTEEEKKELPKLIAIIEEKMTFVQSKLK